MADISELGVKATRGPAQTESFVSVAAVRKAFAGAPALQGIGFEVPLGSTVSLLGPSGCGKTTMLRSIAGLETPDAGRISIDGTVVFDSERMINVAVEKRQIGMVFQSYAVWPHMTVAENVGFPLKIRRVAKPAIAARVREVLNLVGLGGLAERPATALSGGQQQRVALARAIVHEPRLVLFDEPLSNLDAKLRHQMRVELKLLQDRLGFTAIYVTHDQEEALALSDIVIVMNHGRAEAMAPPRKLFAQPSTPFVADFLGFDNMYEGKIDRVESAIAVDGSATRAPSWPISVALEAISLRCVWRGDVPPTLGAPVTVAFRSERVNLRQNGGSHDPRANQYEGVVESCVYLGTYQDYLIRAGSLRLHAVGPGEAMMDPGERVTVSISPDDCIVFAR